MCVMTVEHVTVIVTENLPDMTCPETVSHYLDTIFFHQINNII